MNAYRHHRTPRRRVPVVLLALAGLCLTVAACSSGPSGRQVASLGGHSGGGSGSQQLTTAQSDQDMINWARCMRSHGINVPDPFHRPGHTGLSIEQPAETAANRPAFSACNHFIQPLVQMKLAGAAQLAAPHMRQLTEYARCMRSHDIDMLDPTSFGALNLGNVPGITSNFGRYSPQFGAADAACRHFLPTGVNDNGTGP